MWTVSLTHTGDVYFERVANAVYSVLKCRALLVFTLPESQTFLRTLLIKSFARHGNVCRTSESEDVLRFGRYIGRRSLEDVIRIG